MPSPDKKFNSNTESSPKRNSKSNRSMSKIDARTLEEIRRLDVAT